MASDAVFSRDGRYRYRLRRMWNGHQLLQRVALFVMLNPSTADDVRADPTVRRCLGFARRWGCNSIEIVNLFALVATNPAELSRAAEPIGPDNDHWIETAALGARDRGIVVVAWGANGNAHPDRVAAVGAILRKVGVDVVAFDRELAGGMPAHPLRLPYTLPVRHWPLNAPAS